MPLVNGNTTGVRKTYVLNERADRNPVSSYGTLEVSADLALTSHENNTAIVIRACECSIQRHGEVRGNKQGRSDTKHG